MACFRCNTTKNFIFLLKYRQRNVYLGTSKKSLVFVTIRHLRKDAAFLQFRLKESSENVIHIYTSELYEN